MRAIPAALQRAFSQELENRVVSERERRDWLKWLRYYIDFCLKYHHGPRESGSLDRWLKKLASKGQDAARREQASKSIKLFYEVVQQFPRPEEGSLVREERTKCPSCWDVVHLRMKEAIRVRHYSPKTLKSYRSWVRGFQRFLENRNPEEVTDEDAARYLTHLAVERSVSASTQNQAFNALLFLFRHVWERPTLHEENPVGN